jgi:spectinomycin phosphotransferase/16S rRNA (guanine(1405)-N(7))-methyltransferase
VQSPPDDLDEATLTAALTREWGVAVASLDYRAVGFGSHHWAMTDPAGGTWFVTVDDLRARRLSRTDPLDEAHRRLGAALGTARALRETGAEFVVAPVPTAGGSAVSRVSQRYTAAVYPYVDGESFPWGEWPDTAHRDAALAMVRDVHAAPDAVRRHALADDFAVPHRDALQNVLDGGAATGTGPYAQRTADLITDHAEAVRALLARYDAMVVRADPGRAVLTHGEPHVANTMRTGDGWRLIDWETALLAPPERDLWGLGADTAETYQELTGVRVLPAMLDLYRLRWDLADLAVGTDRFQDPHPGNADDDETWAIMAGIVGGISP